MSDEQYNPAADSDRAAMEAELKALSQEEEVSAEEPTEDTTEKPTSTTDRQYTDLEVEQMEKGWDPNHPDGVSAKEFKRVGEIIEAKRKASKEAKFNAEKAEKLEKTVRALIQQNKEVQEATRQQTLLELHKQKLQKIEEGDVQAVMEIERQQAAVKPVADVDVEPETRPGKTNEEIMANPDVVAFREEYKDILTGTSDEDLAISAYIVRKAEAFTTLQTDEDVKAAIDNIRDGMKKVFPQKFSVKNPNKEKPALTVQSTSSGSNAGNYSTSRLSYDQKALLQQIQEIDSDYKTPKYIESFIKQLELTGKLDK